MCILEKGPPHSRSPRIWGCPARGVDSWSPLPSPPGGPLVKKNGLPWVSRHPPRAPGSLGWGRSTLERGAPSRALFWGALPCARGVRGACQGASEGSACPLSSPEQRRAGAAGLLPSRLGRPEPAPAPVAAAAAAGGCGERGERAEEARAARTGTRRSRRRRGGRTSGGRGGSAAWRRGSGIPGGMG